MPMSQDKANGLIVSALTVSGVLVVVKAASRGDTDLSIRLPVGLTFAGVMLAVGAQISPDLAGGLALLMLTSALLVYGGPAFEAIGGTTTNRSRTPNVGAPRPPATTAPVA